MPQKKPNRPPDAGKWKRLIEQLKPLVPLVHCHIGSGSGLVVSSSGLVLTNRHVVEGAELVGLSFAEGASFRGVVIDRCDTHDLALIRSIAPPRGHFDLSAAVAETVETGDALLSIGHPSGYSFTATRGFVSAAERVFESDGVSRRLIQIDVKIEPGSSGGPSVNESGHLVGINVSGSPTSNHVGFAIPARDVAGYVSSVEQRVESGALALPTEEEVADWNAHPTPEEAVRAAIMAGGNDIKPTVNELPRFRILTWEVPVTGMESQSIRVGLLLDKENCRAGRFGVHCEIAKLTEAQSRDPVLLGDLLRTNADLGEMRLESDSGGAIHLCRKRDAADLDASEVAYAILDANLALRGIAKLTDHIRGGGLLVRESKSWLAKEREKES